MRLLTRFFAGLLLAASASLLGLYAGLPYPRLAARLAAALPPDLPERGLAPVLTPGRYAALRLALALAAGLAGGVLLLTRHPSAPRPGPAGRGWPAAGGRWLTQGLRATWRGLTPGQRKLAGALLLALAAVHLWFAGNYPLTLDELASYDYFVQPGAAVTASFYPLPNNHLLPNLLVGLVHAALPGLGPWAALRLLPTLLGLALLPLGYALLLRYLRFGVATLGWGLFCLSPLPVFYAVAGRGYGWALAALLAGLWASLALLRPAGGLPRPRRQLAWAVFGLSAAGGLYAVPSYLLGLLGLGLGLLLGFARGPRRRRAPALRQLAVAGLGIGLLTGVLYAPVLAVSGGRALVANPYVQHLAAARFWAQLGPYYLLGTASELLGRGPLAAALFALVALASPLALWRGGLAEPARRLGWLAYLQLGLWLPLLLAQRVFAPARTLLAVLLFFFVLAALLGQVSLDWLARQVPGRPRPAAWVQLLALALLLGGYGGYRLGREQPLLARRAHEQRVLRRAYAWLRARHPGRVWLPANDQGVFLYWHHYAVAAGQPPLPVRLRGTGPVGEAPAGAGGGYEVLFAPPAGREPAYADEGLVIVRALVTAPPGQ